MVLNPTLLQAIHHSISQNTQGQAYAVALSGGPDSAVLAVHAAAWAQQESKDIYFFHIHHGLQQVADEWAEHVLHLGHLLQRPTWVKRVQVQARGDGIESAARRARYTALSEMAQQLNIDAILLGHHLGDQAETVLMRLLRGTGPAGMQAMQPKSRRLGQTYLRPFLNIARREILQAAQDFSLHSGWQPVTDPTNVNPRYTRGIIREHLAPVLEQYWPHWQQALGRHAQQAAAQHQLLNEWADELLERLDYRRVCPQTGRLESSFDLSAWRALDAAKQALVLRRFLQRDEQLMPTEARLREMMRQLNQVHQRGTDRRLQIKHGRAFLRCIDGRVLLKRYD